MTDDETLDSVVRIRRVCPSNKTATTYIMHALFRWFDPYVQLFHEADHHIAFQRVYAIVQQLVF